MTAGFSEKTEDKLICESCGKEFFCGVNIGKCWCFEIDLEKETLAELRQDFKNCLCQNCLIKINTQPNLVKPI